MDTTSNLCHGGDGGVRHDKGGKRAGLEKVSGLICRLVLGTGAEMEVRRRCGNVRMSTGSATDEGRLVTEPAIGLRASIESSPESKHNVLRGRPGVRRQEKGRGRFEDEWR